MKAQQEGFRLYVKKDTHLGRKEQRSVRGVSASPCPSS